MEQKYQNDFGKKILFSIFFFILWGYVIGQSDFALEGRLFNSIDSSFVPASNIYTLPGKRGGISDKNGYFYIYITTEDTLYISTIGYRTHTIVCREIIDEGKFRLQIFLEPKIYQLNEVNIFSFLTYEEFKVELLNIPMKEELEYNFDFDAQLYTQLINAPASGGFGIGINGALTSLSDRWSKKGKQLRKLADIKANEKINNYIFSRFNPYVVQRATGLTDEDEIVNFMQFCSFSEYFLLNASEGEMTAAIQKKFEFYNSGLYDRK